jgi:hypothetical protein
MEPFFELSSVPVPLPFSVNLHPSPSVDVWKNVQVSAPLDTVQELFPEVVLPCSSWPSAMPKEPGISASRFSEIAPEAACASATVTLDEGEELLLPEPPQPQRVTAQVRTRERSTFVCTGIPF